MERNLRLYALYAPLSNALFWAPIFFVYLTERFPVEAALSLHAFYYGVVVVSEVPSGYLSDRVGRVLTMRIAAALGVGAYLLFLLGGDELLAFFAAQALLGLHFSFRSGTEASFHYDTLDALHRGEEFAAKAARVQRDRYLAAGLAALVGGAAAVFDLRAAYLLSALGVLTMLGLTLAMAEPPHTRKEGENEAPNSFLQQLRACAAYLRQPFLLWLFAYVVLQTILAHLPYEFYQPYVAVVLGESLDELARTPLVTGVVSAAIGFAGAFAAAQTMRLRGVFGVVGLLLALTALQAALIGAMALWIHAAVIVAICFRSVQPAVGNVVVDAAVAPRVEHRLRATFLSMQSLAGRLAYSAVLIGLSRIVADDPSASTESLVSLLEASAWIAVIGLGLLVVWPRGSRAPATG